MGWFDDDESSDEVVKADPDALSSAWDTVSGYVADATETASNYASSAQETVSNYAAEAVETAGAYATGYAEQAAEAASSVQETVSNYAAEATETVGAYAAGYGEQVSEAVGVAEQTLGGYAESAAQTLGGYVDEASQTLGEYASGAAEALSPVVDAAQEYAEAQVKVIGDAASKYADQAAKDFEADPVGFVAQLAGAPKIDIDLDDSDGNISIKYDGTIAKLDAKYDGEGTSVDGKLGADFGGAPLLEGKVATDADGNLTELSTHAKVTVPIEGVLATAESEFSYKKTEDGFKVGYKNSAGAEVDGVDLSLGTHASYDDHGERGYTVTAGPHGSASIGAEELLPGLNLVDAEATTSIDLSYGTLDGQSTTGVHQTSKLEGKVLGETIISGQIDQGVAYTTGPNGEQIIVDQKFSGEAGTDYTGKLSGSTGAQWNLGTDAQGNDVDRVTITNEATATMPGQAPVTYSSTTVHEDATGAPDWLRSLNESDDDTLPQGYGGSSDGQDTTHQYREDNQSMVAPGSAGVGPATPDGEFPMDMVRPDLRREPAPEPNYDDVPLDMISPDWKPGDGDDSEYNDPSNLFPQTPDTAPRPDIPSTPSTPSNDDVPLNMISPDWEPEVKPVPMPVPSDDDVPLDMISPDWEPEVQPVPMPSGDRPLTSRDPGWEPDAPPALDLDQFEPTVDQIVKPAAEHVEQSVVEQIDQPMVEQIDQQPYVEQSVVEQIDQQPYVEQSVVEQIDQQPYVEQSVEEQIDQPMVEQIDEQPYVEPAPVSFEPIEEVVVDAPEPEYVAVAAVEEPPSFESVIENIDSSASAFEGLADFGESSDAGWAEG